MSFWLLFFQTHVDGANGDTVELVAVGVDVKDIEVIGEVVSRRGEALSSCLRALDEDGGTVLRGDGLNALLEEGRDHCKAP